MAPAFWSATRPALTDDAHTTAGADHGRHWRTSEGIRCKARLFDWSSVRFRKLGGGLAVGGWVLSTGGNVVACVAGLCAANYHKPAPLVLRDRGGEEANPQSLTRWWRGWRQ
jgi:hypothetical protein